MRDLYTIRYYVGGNRRLMEIPDLERADALRLIAKRRGRVYLLAQWTDYREVHRDGRLMSFGPRAAQQAGHSMPCNASGCIANASHVFNTHPALTARFHAWETVGT